MKLLTLPLLHLTFHMLSGDEEIESDLFLQKLSKILPFQTIYTLFFINSLNSIFQETTKGTAIMPEPQTLFIIHWER